MRKIITDCASAQQAFDPISSDQFGDVADNREEKHQYVTDPGSDDSLASQTMSEEGSSSKANQQMGSFGQKPELKKARTADN